MDRENLTLLCDFYEYTMANGYLESGMQDTVVYYDMFFRNVPDKGGYAVMAGLEQVIRRVQEMSFSDEDIEFFRSKGIFSERFLEYLRGFRFTGDIYAVPEGTPIFPGEPIVTVRATAPQAQMLETMILLTINHQSMIATKANRIVRSAGGRAVMEFGSRRAQGSDAAILGARAAYIGGCAGTACTIADREYGIPASGTMAHSWVQTFDSELEAFETYCRIYPGNATLLVDTYDVLNSGVPNAIKAFKEVLWPMGIRKCAIRIDSGDLAFLSREARRMLDEAGLTECSIVASNSLDEWIIRDLIDQGACIDAFGVGDKLITSHSNPVFGGVYKLAGTEDGDGNVIPKIKISNNTVKITTPGFKKVYRLFDRSGMAIADLVCLHDETVDTSKPLTLTDPEARWKRKTISGFTARELLVPIFKNGELVYDPPSLPEIRENLQVSLGSFWEEIKRLNNPHQYYVDLSDRLWELKESLLKEYGRQQ
jgi:nicotinate phosphoribosyltransferase